MAPITDRPELKIWVNRAGRDEWLRFGGICSVIEDRAVQVEVIFLRRVNRASLAVIPDPRLGSPGTICHYFGPESIFIGQSGGSRDISYRQCGRCNQCDCYSQCSCKANAAANVSRQHAHCLMENSPPETLYFGRIGPLTMS